MSKQLRYKLILVFIVFLTFVISYEVSYNSIVYTKAFPSLPKPPFSITLEDTRGSQIITYDIIINNNNKGSKSEYIQLLKDHKYTINDNNDIIKATKKNNEYNITFEKDMDETIVKIEKVK